MKIIWPPLDEEYGNKLARTKLNHGDESGPLTQFFNLLIFLQPVDRNFKTNKCLN
jgi:hypothetical protein